MTDSYFSKPEKAKEPFIRCFREKILLALMAFLIPISSFADSKNLLCDNQILLLQPVALKMDGEIFNLFQGEVECALLEEPNPPYDSNYEGWVFLTVAEPDCELQTKLSTPSNRNLLQIRVSPSVLRGEKGPVRMSLDNQMAEYGPDSISSFFNCRPL